MNSLSKLNVFLPTIAYFAIMLLLGKSFILISFLYLPGIVFAIGVFLIFERKLTMKNNVFLFLSVVVLYYFILIFLNKNVEFLLPLRVLLFACFGALAVLYLVQIFSNVIFIKQDFFIIVSLGIIVGLISFYSDFDPDIISYMIFFWQVVIIFIIKNRLFSQSKT